MHSVHTCAVVCSSRMSYLRVRVCLYVFTYIVYARACVCTFVYARVCVRRTMYVVHCTYIRVYMCLCRFISMRLCVRILVAMEIINVKLY